MTHNAAHSIRHFLATALAGSAVALAFASALVHAAAKTTPTQSITGRIVDVRTRQPLAGVEVKVLRSARHGAGTVKALGLPGAPLDAITTRREFANTFTSGDRGSIGVARNGSAHCE